MRSRDRLCVGFGAAALLASTLLLGGVFRWTQALVSTFVALSVATQISSRRKLDRLSPVVVLLVLAIGLTTLQLVPLPPSLVAAFDPTNATLRSDGAALVGASPWPCLSMDIAGTLRGLAFLTTLLGVALVSLRLASPQRGRYLLLGGVALSCGLVAAVTAGHALVNASRIYGIYELPVGEPIVAPLINANHLGCLMALGATVSIGLAFYEKQRSGWRAAWVVTCVACTSVALLSESRGAAVSLTIGIVVTGALLISSRLGEVARDGRRRALSTGKLPTAIVLTLGFALAVYSTAGGVAEQLGRTNLGELQHATSKFAAWKWAPELVRESPWVGVGRGAVEPVFTHVFPATAYATFGHLENEYIEAIAEFGVPGALTLAIVLGWAILNALRKWRDGPLAAAALGGLAGVMFQSSVDFGVELLGVAVPVTVVACTLQLVPLRESAVSSRLRISRGGLVVALAAAAALLLSSMTTTLDEDHEALMAGEYGSIDAIAEVVQRHPLDYFAFGTGGQQLIRDHDARAGTFLNHALRLHPYQPGLHRMVARLLIRIGAKSQAALEYSLAMTGTPPHLLLKEILAMLPSAGDDAAAIPLDYPMPSSILGSLSEFKRDDVAILWLVRRVLDRPSQELALIDALYDLAFARKDYAIALRAASKRLAAANTPTSRLKIARVRYAQQDFAGVYAELADVETWGGRLDERGDAWLLVCDSFRDERRWDDALRCLHRLDASGSLSTRREDIVLRESDVSDRRTNEIRTKQIQDLERSLKLPVDGPLPVIHAAGADDAIPNPLTRPGIQNPIRNPLSSPPQ